MMGESRAREAANIEKNSKITVDIGYKSLNKKGEELCGDKVEILRTEHSHIHDSGRWDGERREGQYFGDYDLKNFRNHVPERKSAWNSA